VTIWLCILTCLLFMPEVASGEDIPLVPIIPKTHTHLGSISNVLSAETFRISGLGGMGTVRIQGINCISKCKKPNCVQAQQDALNEVTKRLENNNVMLECDGECRVDKFKRRLHYVVLPDISDFGLSLVRRGFCQAWKVKDSHPRFEDYLRAQDEAKKAKVGMWKAQ
jgi:endonuclease YncB( thermonuclease family)